MDAPTLQNALALLPMSAIDGLTETMTTPAVAAYSRTLLKTTQKRVLVQPMPLDAASTAHELFAVLRDLDTQGVQEIWIETPPESPEWDGVRDRLQRAAAS
jgi:L-threonylcarbamoyladenylate synthase